MIDDDSKSIVHWLNKQSKTTSLNDLPNVGNQLILWQFNCELTSLILPTHHMQQELAPTREVDATSYAFHLSSINRWPMPPSLKKRLQIDELNRMHLMKVTCSMSMTCFHSKSKQFYGSTWVVHEHPCMIKSSSTKLVLENFSELTYFFTRITIHAVS